MRRFTEIAFGLSLSRNRSETVSLKETTHYNTSQGRTFTPKSTEPDSYHNAVFDYTRFPLTDKDSRVLQIKLTEPSWTNGQCQEIQIETRDHDANDTNKILECLPARSDVESEQLQCYQECSQFTSSWTSSPHQPVQLSTPRSTKSSGIKTSAQISTKSFEDENQKVSNTENDPTPPDLEKYLDQVRKEAMYLKQNRLQNMYQGKQLEDIRRAGRKECCRCKSIIMPTIGKCGDQFCQHKCIRCTGRPADTDMGPSPCS